MSRFHVIRGEGDFEQVAMAEVLIPNTPNSYADIYTEEAVKEFAYEFARKGYKLDIEHDNVDAKSKFTVVESFIAREGDPTFIKGSWVVAIKVHDDQMWQDILAGELNGFSYEATVEMLPVLVENLANRQVQGITEPDPHDGHTHEYLVILNALNKPVSGGTGFSNGHAHTISIHTVTDLSNGHSHRYQVIKEN